MEDAIRQATSAVAFALANRDAAQAAAYYENDGRLLAASEDVISGRDAIEAYWRAGLAVGLSRLDLDASEVRLVDPLAIEIGRYTLAVGTAVAERGHYLVLHRRQPGGAWQRVVEVFNPDVPAARPHKGGARARKPVQ